MSKSLWKECSGGEKKLKIQRKARFAEGEVWEPDHRLEENKAQRAHMTYPPAQPGPRSPVFFFLCSFFFLLLKLECSRGSDRERGVETKTSK